MYAASPKCCKTAGNDGYIHWRIVGVLLAVAIAGMLVLAADRSAGQASPDVVSVVSGQGAYDIVAIDAVVALDGQIPPLTPQDSADMAEHVGFRDEVAGPTRIALAAYPPAPRLEIPSADLIRALDHYSVMVSVVGSCLDAGAECANARIDMGDSLRRLRDTSRALRAAAGVSSGT